MEVFSRIRWGNLGPVLAVIAAVVVIVAVGPGLFERPKPPPLAANIGLRGAAEPPKRGPRVAFLSHTERKATQAARNAARPPKPHRPSPPHRSHPGRHHHPRHERHT